MATPKPARTSKPAAKATRESEPAPTAAADLSPAPDATPADVSHAKSTRAPSGAPNGFLGRQES